MAKAKIVCGYKLPKDVGTMYKNVLLSYGKYEYIENEFYDIFGILVEETDENLSVYLGKGEVYWDVDPMDLTTILYNHEIIPSEDFPPSYYLCAVGGK